MHILKYYKRTNRISSSFTTSLYCIYQDISPAMILLSLSINCRYRSLCDINKLFYKHQVYILQCHY